MDVTRALSDVLLVHGASHDASSWDALRVELGRRGVVAAAVDLPSSGGLFGMEDDARAIRHAVAYYRPRVVVCHSYGGMPTTSAVRSGTSVGHVIYLTALVPDVGDSLASLSADVPEDGAWEMSADEDWIQAVDPRDLFYGLCEASISDAAVAALRPQAVRAFNERLNNEPSWRSVESSYILCLHDRAIPLSLQERMAARTRISRSLPSDHSPFLSMPGRTADAIIDLAFQSGANRP